MAVSQNPTRGLRRALFVSVAVNLLVVGAVSGMLVAHGFRNERDGHSERRIGFGRYTQALSPEDRAALRAAYRAQVTELRGDDLAGDGDDDTRGPGSGNGGPRAAFRVEQAALVAALRADPFDPEAVATAFERQHTQMTAGIALGQKLLLQRIIAMSSVERAAFAERLETAPGHEHERRHGRAGR